jgi:hypothetical protein
VEREEHTYKGGIDILPKKPPLLVGGRRGNSFDMVSVLTA